MKRLNVEGGPPTPALVARRCAFARRGLSAPEFLACPGFENLGTRYPALDGGGRESVGFTCEHLELSETQRGYMACCGHPDGPFDQWLPVQRQSVVALGDEREDRGAQAAVHPIGRPRVLGRGRRDNARVTFREQDCGRFPRTRDRV